MDPRDSTAGIAMCYYCVHITFCLYRSSLTTIGGHIAWLICLLIKLLTPMLWGLPTFPIETLHCKEESVRDVSCLAKLYSH